jgi:flagellar assembly protein FliH
MVMPQRFTFETSFDHVENTSARRPLERRYTPAELDAARQAALAEGHAAGRAEALAETAAATATKAAESLARLAEGLSRMIAAADETRAETERRAVGAVQGIITKLLPGLAARDPLAEVETFAKKCLHEIIDEPRVVLRVSATLYDGLRERLDPIAAASGYAGRIILLADDFLADGDARIEWADGGAERELVRQTNEITNRLAATISAAAAAPTFAHGDDV